MIPALNGAGESLVDAFRTDTRNVYAGAITLTQPLYMGGKIRAYNKITKYAEELGAPATPFMLTRSYFKYRSGLLASGFTGK